MSAAQSREEHPNNAPGVPMLVPPALENFQIRYINPVIAPLAKRLPGGFTIVKHRGGRKSGTPVRDDRHQLPQGQHAGHRPHPRQDQLGEERARGR